MTIDDDVAVVGGGPAGASTAMHLVRVEGLAPSRVLILEKARHPRDKPCAGAVSAWGLEALAALGVPLEVPHATMRGFRIVAAGRAGDVLATDPAGWGVVVRRCEFDASLWRHAASDGVIALDGEPLVDLARAPDGWTLRTPARTVTARFVAACDGAGSAVRKLLRVPEAARKGHLYVAETSRAPADRGPSGGLCEFDLRVADAGVQGYYWDFPNVVDGAPGVSRGIYHANFTACRDLKRHMLQALAARGVDASRVRLKAFSTRPLVRGAPLRQDGLALVGEAAGIDATTGEGIAQAILTGAIAARHLARAVRGGDPTLEGYEDDVLSGRVGRHLLQSAWLSRRVYGARGSAWRNFLAGHAGARHVGARWYAGKALGWADKARVGAALALGLLAGGGAAAPLSDR